MHIPDLIRSLGGPTAVQRYLGVGSPATVACWSKRQSIPKRHWRGILQMGADKGVTLSAEGLMDAHGSVLHAPEARAKCKRGESHAMSHSRDGSVSDAP